MRRPQLQTRAPSAGRRSVAQRARRAREALSRVPPVVAAPLASSALGSESAVLQNLPSLQPVRFPSATSIPSTSGVVRVPVAASSQIISDPFHCIKSSERRSLGQRARRSRESIFKIPYHGPSSAAVPPFLVPASSVASSSHSASYEPSLSSVLLSADNRPACISQE
ncbi:hypothetical protein AQUCO_00600117v1 [Aquilegia coerulea]|uniref:Uncharacterized protein n=1 Tax=Aquilegia coerulea TaxID=218851 RepID=A0A2G5EN92_AQUCA|nr:hypothetical protein AQUCO_00600117v1 [Aquilegia coerulea]